MSVAVDQFLHGYSNGHRLLASSTRPDSRLAARLLSHSDAPAAGETRLLASLPLPEWDAWALTCVWAAEEVGRPGSVWSHTLLLDRAALGDLRGAAGLLAALRRPAQREGLGAYRVRLEVEDRSEDIVDEAALALAPSIVLAAYGWPGLPTAVIAEDLESAGRVLVAIWQRQWPELRAAFRFRTRRRLGDEAGSGVEVASRPARRPVAGRIELPAGQVSLEEAPSWLGRSVRLLRLKPSGGVPARVRARSAEWQLRPPCPGADRGGIAALAADADRGGLAAGPFLPRAGADGGAQVAASGARRGPA